MSSKEIYCSFLPRIWVEETDGDQWRFSLEDTRTGNRRGFSSLMKMVIYLSELIAEDCKVEGIKDNQGGEMGAKLSKRSDLTLRRKK